MARNFPHKTHLNLRSQRECPPVNECAQGFSNTPQGIYCEDMNFLLPICCVIHTKTQFYRFLVKNTVNPLDSSRCRTQWVRQLHHREAVAHTKGKIHTSRIQSSKACINDFVDFLQAMSKTIKKRAAARFLFLFDLGSIIKCLL